MESHRLVKDLPASLEKTGALFMDPLHPRLENLLISIQRGLGTKNQRRKEATQAIKAGVRERKEEKTRAKEKEDKR